MRIDLDAAKAARREARGEGPTVVFGGKEFTLEPEIPWEAAELFAAGNAPEALRLVLGDSHKDFMAAKPSVPDMEFLMEKLTKSNGLADLGESSASGVSS